MRKFATALLLAATMASGAFCSRADALPIPITYDIFDQVGTFTVTGTVTTDGTVGLVTKNNFLDWDLALNQNGTAINTLIKGDGSFILTNSILDASPTSLTFDHSLNSTFFLIISQNLQSFWCVQGVASVCGGPPSVSAIDTSLGGGIAPRSGVVQYGTLAVPAVPEPSTWALMLLGFAGLGYLGYRKSLPRTA
jgi:hypothetical protein